MTKWEYLASEPPETTWLDWAGEQCSSPAEWDSAVATEWLDKLGGDGWELVAIQGRVGVFKRSVK